MKTGYKNSIVSEMIQVVSSCFANGLFDVEPADSEVIKEVKEEAFALASKPINYLAGMDVLREIELDIAMNAGAQIAQGNIEDLDSRTFLDAVVREWAIEFYVKYKLDKTSPRDDYMELIDRFSEKKLRKEYGIPKSRLDKAE